MSSQIHAAASSQVATTNGWTRLGFCLHAATLFSSLLAQRLRSQSEERTAACLRIHSQTRTTSLHEAFCPEKNLDTCSFTSPMIQLKPFVPRSRPIFEMVVGCVRSLCERQKPKRVSFGSPHAAHRKCSAQPIHIGTNIDSCICSSSRFVTSMRVSCTKFRSTTNKRASKRASKPTAHPSC